MKHNRTDTTERILDALEQQLAEQGLDGASITQIAQKANVSKVLIYQYFGNLEGLMTHYVQTGRLIPKFSENWLKQIQPSRAEELGPIWSCNALHIFRKFRASRSAREVLKATVKENDSLADTVSKTLDNELTKLVDQLSFVKGPDYQAISAVLLGGLSYLTIQSQQDRTVIGLDMRSEADWQRIEGAVKVMYQALTRLASESPASMLALKKERALVGTW
jgi:AcrR family transcriptional regulator